MQERSVQRGIEDETQDRDVPVFRKQWTAMNRMKMRSTTVEKVEESTKKTMNYGLGVMEVVKDGTTSSVLG